MNAIKGKYGFQCIYQVVLATASPDKFPEAVEKAEIVNKPNPNITKLFEMEARQIRYLKLLKYVLI